MALTAQKWQWVQHTVKIPKTNRNTEVDANDAITDSKGNVYVSGSFQSPAYFTSANGKGITYDIISPDAMANSFIAKYDSLGNLLWINSCLNCQSKGMRMGIDAANNIYMLGYYQRATIFSSTDGKNRKLPDCLSQSAYIIKYDADGNITWLTNIVANDKGTLLPNDLAVSKAGNLYIACGMANGFISSAQFNSVSAARQSIQTNLEKKKSHHQHEFHMMVKYNSEGNFVWARPETYQTWGPSVERICVDDKDNYYVAGDYYRELVINGDTLEKIAAGHAYYIVKFNAEGKVKWWAHMREDSKANRIPARFPMLINKSNQLVIAMAHCYKGELKSKSGVDSLFVKGKIQEANTNIVLACFKEDGKLEWFNNNAGTDGTDEVYAMACGAKNDYYIAGFYTAGSMIGKPGQYDEDIFVSKFDSKGRKKWLLPAGTTVKKDADPYDNSHYVYLDWARGIAVDTKENVYVCGVFFTGAYFGNIFIDEKKYNSKTASALMNIKPIHPNMQVRNIFVGKIGQQRDTLSAAPLATIYYEAGIGYTDTIKRNTGTVSTATPASTPPPDAATNSDEKAKLCSIPDFNVYPNPTDGPVTIEISFEKRSCNFFIVITDLNGKEFYRRELLDLGGTYKAQVELNGVASSAYVVTVYNSINKKTKKIILQK